MTTTSQQATTAMSQQPKMSTKRSAFKRPIDEVPSTSPPSLPNDVQHLDQRKRTRLTDMSSLMMPILPPMPGRLDHLAIAASMQMNSLSQFQAPQAAGLGVLLSGIESLERPLPQMQHQFPIAFEMNRGTVMPPPISPLFGMYASGPMPFVPAMPMMMPMHPAYQQQQQVAQQFYQQHQLQQQQQQQQEYQQQQQQEYQQQQQQLQQQLQHARQRQQPLKQLIKPKQQTFSPASSMSSENFEEEDEPSSPTNNTIDALPADGISVSLDKYLKSTNETVITIRTSCVAQKSYGQEKRFLCPPPTLQIAGQLSAAKKIARVALVNEEGQRGINCNAVLDEQGRTSFKYLHVADTFKSKQFYLRFKLNNGAQQTGSSASATSSVSDDIVTSASASVSGGAVAFDSKPIHIISKPSKKTTKSGNNSMAILSGAMVCLFNRVNSQTVRTKYMTVDQKQLCAKNTTWSAFEILAVTEQSIDGAGSVINYGTPILLRNVETGVYSEQLVVKKVAKDEIVQDAVGPVSQMQKIALVLATAQNMCLSIVPSTTYGTSTPFLCFKPFSETRQLDNHMSWTIVGIEKTQIRNTSSLEVPSVRAARSHSAGFELTGANLQGIQSASLLLPNGGIHRCAVRSAQPQSLSIFAPIQMVDNELVGRFGTQTSFGVSLCMGILLETAEKTQIHSGHFVIYEKMEPANRLTVRVVDP